MEPCDHWFVHGPEVGSQSGAEHNPGDIISVRLADDTVDNFLHRSNAQYCRVHLYEPTANDANWLSGVPAES